MKLYCCEAPDALYLVPGEVGRLWHAARAAHAAHAAHAVTSLPLLPQKTLQSQSSERRLNSHQLDNNGKRELHRL